MSDIQDIAPETTEKLAEFADDYLLKVKSKYGLLGFAIGAASAAVATYFITKTVAEKEANARADIEIAEMRDHWKAKGVALEAQMGKGDLSEIVQEKGYKTKEPEQFTSPPMAVQPPSSVANIEDTRAGEPPDDSVMAVNEIEGENGIRTRNVFQERERRIPYEWISAEERKRRSPDRPYVIHQDERYEIEGYSEVSYTYYAADDVLCNERDEVVDPADRDNLIGEANLERFGHGCDDPMIVHIRNDNLEIVYEIIKSPNSFAEEVHGFTHEGWDRGNLEKMRRRERDVEG